MSKELFVFNHDLGPFWTDLVGARALFRIHKLFLTGVSRFYLTALCFLIRTYTEGFRPIFGLPGSYSLTWDWLSLRAFALSLWLSFLDGYLTDRHIIRFHLSNSQVLNYQDPISCFILFWGWCLAPKSSLSIDMSNSLFSSCLSVLWPFCGFCTRGQCCFGRWPCKRVSYIT